MKSFKDIEQLVRDSRVSASAATDERILGTLKTEGTESPEDSPAAGPTHETRFPLYRLIAVAALLILGIGVFSLFFPGSHPIAEPLVWADIQAAIAEQNGVFITGTRRCVFPASDTEPEAVYSYRTEKWASQAGYIDNTLELDGTPVMQLCYHYESGTITILYHFIRQYHHFQVPEIYRTQLNSMTPQGLVERLFQTDAESLEPKRINGRPAAGYTITDMDRRLDENLSPSWLRYFFINFTQSQAQLWIDLETKLPLHMEGDFTLDKCLFSDFIPMDWKEVSDHWDWGVSIKDETFFPPLPAGYTNMGLPTQAAPNEPPTP